MKQEIYVLRSNPKRTVRIIKEENGDTFYFDIQKDERNRQNSKSFHTKFRKAE
jgi:hypothetical protein